MPHQTAARAMDAAAISLVAFGAGQCIFLPPMVIESTGEEHAAAPASVQ